MRTPVHPALNLRSISLRTTAIRLVIVLLMILAPGNLVTAALPPVNDDRDLVQQALQAEIASPESRSDLLKQALKINPKNQEARWHLGQVLIDGQWFDCRDLKPFENTDELNTYRRIRERTHLSYDRQLRLANWCRLRGLHDRERAHLTAALERSKEPNNLRLRARLGYKQVNGQWIHRDDYARQKQERDEYLRDLHRWRSRVEKLAIQLESSRNSERAAALRDLSDMTDPEMLPALEVVLGAKSPQSATDFVTHLGGLKTYRAAGPLARCALLSPWEEVRELASKQLRTRRIDAFAPDLLSSLRTPIDSRVGLFVRGGNIDLIQLASSETQNAQQAVTRRSTTIINPIGNRSTKEGKEQIEDARNQAIYNARLRAEMLKKGVKVQNEKIEEWNTRVCTLLADAVGVDLAPVPSEWWEWWQDYNQMTEQPKEYQYRYYYERKTANVLIAPPPRTRLESSQGSSSECLVAGTPVWTDRGFIGVEEVQIGDLVLAKDPQTGRLAYQPVLRTTIRSEEPILKVATSSGTIRATGGHMFWIVGQGWTRLRNAKVGQRFHGATGPVEIEGLEPDGTAKTYNIVVADFHDYFVGPGLVLSHDPTFAEPTDLIVPGLGTSQVPKE